MTAAPIARRIGPAVQWRDWDGEIVAYNDRTGDTHHFADLAAWMFRLLIARTLDESGIHAAAEAEIELPPRSTAMPLSHAPSLCSINWN